MGPTASPDPAAPGSIDDASVAAVRRDAVASGRAQRAMQGQGVQNVYFVGPESPSEAAVSIAPPSGLRDPALPLRGRDQEAAELSRPGLGVVVVCGMGGCGKTRLALEAAFVADRDVADGRGWLRPLNNAAGSILATSRDASPGSWGPWCQRRRLARRARGAQATS
jgi:hypothetical protein